MALYVTNTQQLNQWHLCRQLDSKQKSEALSVIAPELFSEIVPEIEWKDFWSAYTQLPEDRRKTLLSSINEISFQDASPSAIALLVKDSHSFDHRFKIFLAQNLPLEHLPELFNSFNLHEKIELLNFLNEIERLKVFAKSLPPDHIERLCYEASAEIINIFLEVIHPEFYVKIYEALHPSVKTKILEKLYRDRKSENLLETLVASLSPVGLRKRLSCLATKRMKFMFTEFEPSKLWDADVVQMLPNMSDRNFQSSIIQKSHRYSIKLLKKYFKLFTVNQFKRFFESSHVENRLRILLINKMAKENLREALNAVSESVRIQFIQYNIFFLTGDEIDSMEPAHFLTGLTISKHQKTVLDNLNVAPKSFVKRIAPLLNFEEFYDAMTNLTNEASERRLIKHLTPSQLDGFTHTISMKVAPYFKKRFDATALQRSYTQLQKNISTIHSLKRQGKVSKRHSELQKKVILTNTRTRGIHRDVAIYSLLINSHLVHSDTEAADLLHRIVQYKADMVEIIAQMSKVGGSSEQLETKRRQYIVQEQSRILAVLKEKNITEKDLKNNDISWYELIQAKLNFSKINTVADLKSQLEGEDESISFREAGFSRSTSS